MVGHVVAECTMLPQKYYKNWRYDKVAHVIHWRLCERFGFKRSRALGTPQTICGNGLLNLIWPLT